MATAAAPAEARSTARAKSRVPEPLADIGRAAILPCIILAIWSALSDGGFVPKYLLPSPGQVLAAGWDFIVGGQSAQAYSGAFLAHFWASLKRVLAGFA